VIMAAGPARDSRGQSLAGGAGFEPARLGAQSFSRPSLVVPQMGGVGLSSHYAGPWAGKGSARLGASPAVAQLFNNGLVKG
jgi:hypothetical protein